MTDAPTNPTDTAICGLLAAGPLPTAALAARLGIPERTARHRLYRLRQAGAVVTGVDGLHHLAAPATTAAITGALPLRDGTVTVAGTTGALPSGDGTAVDRAVPVIAPEHPDHDGSSPRQVGGWRTGTVLAAIAFGLAAAGGIAITVAIHRRAPPLSPPPSPAPARPLGFGYRGDPWGGMPW